MGKLLMYGESSQPGWTGYKPLTEQKIDDQIKDSVNNRKNKSKLPRVSVPSPFARFDLVQKAFGNVASKGKNADTRDRVLVSHALDVAQLFFEIDSHPDIKIVKWNKNEAIEELKKSNIKGHMLLGETLELYTRQENYGFNEKDYYSANGTPYSDITIYILTYAGDAVGCTSPTSLFMATPRFTEFQGLIKIEGDKPLFLNNKELCERDEAFVEYIYKLCKVIKTCGGNEPLKKFKEYLEQQKEEIHQKNNDLYCRINGLNDPKEDDLENDYERTEVNVLGHTLYKRREESLTASIPDVSDFVIKSEKSSERPLVLTNHCPYNNWRYYAKNAVWNPSTHQIDYSSRKRDKLPGTEIEYPWLCENDFLSDAIVMLPYPLDSHFFNGNFVGDGTHSYLPPIKSKFFTYFDFDYLKGKNGNNLNFKIEEEKKKNEIISVTVTLLVTVRGGKPLALKKKYEMPDSVEEGLRYQSLIPDYALGRIVECPIALAVFPFARLKNNNYYTLQLARAGYGWDDFKVSMEAYQKADVDKGIDWAEEVVKRSKNTYYFSIKDAFDYLCIKIEDDCLCRNESVLIPEWGEPKEGTSKFKFAFDFGTTNSYVSVIDMENNNIKELCLNTSIVSTLDLCKLADLKDDNATLLHEYMKQEFLPDEVGKDYSFPLRTVVSVPKSLNLTTSPRALNEVNIPFIYGKEDYGTDRNRIKPNIKWSRNEEEQKLANAFIEELALLARGFAIENEANLPECSFVWTYPLSMRAKDIKDSLNEQWKECFKKYFEPTKDREDISESNVSKLTESIAPLLYYLDTDKALLEMTLSIDIGGGTCDVVIMNGNTDDVKVASFRFAADVIFGAGKAVENPMIQTHCDYFQNLLERKDDDIRKVKDMLLKICKDTETESTEANSVLFSLENHPLLGKIAIEDRSYNRRLKLDDKRKIIFLYFYASIIYYLIKLLQDYGYPKPKKILFSGTGSKLLNIIGGKEILQLFTTQFIEKFSEGKFSYTDEIEIEIERKKPKQLTAIGALCKKPTSQAIAAQFADPNKAKANTIRYSMLHLKNGEPDKLTYADLSDDTKKNQLVEEVKNFNRHFRELSKSLKFIDEYGCEGDSMKIVEKYLDKDLKAYLDTEISDNVKIDGNENDEFEDALFFYPIKGVIRQLIRSIK